MPDPTQNPLSVDDFAAKVKAKYPDYAKMDNLELAQKIVSKHPEYQGQVALPSLAEPSMGPSATTYDSTHKSLAAPPSAAKRFASGAGLPTSQSEATDAVRGFLTPQADPNESDKLVRLEEQIPVLGGDFRARADLSKRADNETGAVGAVHKLASFVPFAGPALTAAQDKYDQGDYAGAAGAGLNAFLSMAGLKSAVTPKPSLALKPGATPETFKAPLGDLSQPAAGLPREAAISNLRDAVNPVSQDTPGLTKNLSTQLDTLVRQGKKPTVATKVPLGGHTDLSRIGSGIPTNLQEMADVAGSAAKADPYRAMFIDKYEPEVVSTGHIAGHDPMGTIGSLDDRLTQINKTITPKYVRGADGSVQQVAALGAQDVAALQEEAAAIRTTLAQELSKRTGIPAEDIAKARANYGQLNDIRDTAQWYADNQRYGGNKAANAPLDTHITGIGAVNSVINKVRGNPGSKAIRKTFSDYSPAAAQDLSQSAQPATPKPPRVPLWKQAEQSGGGNVPEPIASAMSGTPPPPASTVPPVLQELMGAGDVPATLSNKVTHGILLGEPQPVHGMEGVADYPLMRGDERVGHARIVISNGVAHVGWFGPDDRAMGAPVHMTPEEALSLRTQFEAQNPGVKLKLTPGSATAERAAARVTRRQKP